MTLPFSSATCRVLASFDADAPCERSSPNSVNCGETGARPDNARPRERYADDRFSMLDALDGVGEAGRARMAGTAVLGRGW
jgi:hypothetical protein